MTTCSSTRTPSSRATRPRCRARLCKLRGGLLPLCLVFLLGVPAAASEWPLARGDRAGTGASKQGLPDEPRLLWQYKPGGETAFEATPVVAGGVVYLGDADGTLHAVGLDTGKPVWKRTIEDSGFTAGAAVAGGRLFVGDYNGVVRCFSLAGGDEGSEAWSFATESEVNAAPIPHGDTLLVTTEAGELIALAAATGDERWRFQIDGPLRCSPTVLAGTGGSGHALLAGCDARLTAVDLATGREAGAVDIGGQTGSTAAILGRRAYFGTEAGEFLAVDAGDPATPKIAWRYRDPRRGQGIRTAAAVTDQLVAYGSNGKALYGLRPADGEALWEKPVRSRVESSPVIVRGPQGAARVVAATARGRLLMLDAASGETLWQYDAGGGFAGSPAVAAGRLLIANTDGTLYCFGGGE
ncbi:MAG: PQQ-binding-like beta-propeller repeat protein [Planctomycetota bacterium]